LVINTIRSLIRRHSRATGARCTTKLYYTPKGIPVERHHSYDGLGLEILKYNKKSTILS